MENERKDLEDVSEEAYPNHPQTGDDPEAALEMLKRLCDEQFNGEPAAAALALGREPAEIKAYLAGEQEIDADLEQKIRGIALTRGVDLGDVEKEGEDSKNAASI
ncbi:MAG: hypothetical protein H0V76_08530 [Blastocatellia bacterium]|nr:hypothetical protein [Blastocatellia bacterium]